MEPARKAHPAESSSVSRPCHCRGGLPCVSSCAPAVAVIDPARSPGSRLLDAPHLHQHKPARARHASTTATKSSCACWRSDAKWHSPAPHPAPMKPSPARSPKGLFMHRGGSHRRVGSGRVQGVHRDRGDANDVGVLGRCLMIWQWFGEARFAPSHLRRHQISERRTYARACRSPVAFAKEGKSRKSHKSRRHRIPETRTKRTAG